MMKRTSLTLLSLVLFSVIFLGCPPPPVAVRAGPPADLTAIYLGNHNLNFNITSPVPQNMPPEVREGPIHVYDTAGASVRISLRLEQNGEPCHLDGTRQAGTGRVIINPGQRCSIRILYQGNPVLAAMQVNQGVADFSGWNLATDISGPFVAEALYQGRRTSLQGNARITFSGNRQQQRPY